MQRPRPAQGFGRVLDSLEEAVLVGLFAVMFAIEFANVITRYFLHYALAFTEELVLAAFVWATLLGAAVAFRRGAHLAFTFFTEQLPSHLRRVALWGSTLCTIVLFAALIFYGLHQVQLERQTGFVTEALALPQWWYTLGVPVLAALCLFRALQAALPADRFLRG